MSEAPSGDMVASSDALSQLLAVQDENVELRKKIHDLENQLVVLRGDLDEIKVVEEMRADFDEYQRDCQQKLDAERSQLEAAKASLQTERVRTMAEKTISEENVHDLYANRIALMGVGKAYWWFAE